MASPPISNCTGGTESTDGNYKYHLFTTSGTLTVISGAAGVEVLIVGGGGGGGCTYTCNSPRSGGGAGAGGSILVRKCIYSGTYNVNPGTHWQAGGYDGSVGIYMNTLV